MEIYLIGYWKIGAMKLLFWMKFYAQNYWIIENNTVLNILEESKSPRKQETLCFWRIIRVYEWTTRQQKNTGK